MKKTENQFRKNFRERYAIVAVLILFAGMALGIMYGHIMGPLIGL